jgi:hypothetical protein
MNVSFVLAAHVDLTLGASLSAVLTNSSITGTNLMALGFPAAVLSFLPAVFLCARIAYPIDGALA